MEEKDVKTLESAGMTNAQAIIYLTLLELGQTKVGTLIEKTSLQSSVVHNNVNKLIEKGLITFVLIGKVKHYAVADPKVFLDFLDEQKELIEQRKSDIRQILPKLNLIKEESKRTTEVEVYRGAQGFRTSYLDAHESLKDKGAYQFIGLPAEYQADEKLQDVFKRTLPIISEKKVNVSGIGNIKVKPVWDKAYAQNKLFALKYFEDDLPFGISIFGETVLLSLWGDDPIVISVKNRAFREKAYNYFWKKWKEIK